MNFSFLSGLQISELTSGVGRKVEMKGCLGQAISKFWNWPCFPFVTLSFWTFPGNFCLIPEWKNWYCDWHLLAVEMSVSCWSGSRRHIFSGDLKLHGLICHWTLSHYVAQISMLCSLKLSMNTVNELLWNIDIWQRWAELADLLWIMCFSTKS